MVSLFVLLSCFFVSYSYIKTHDAEKLKKNILLRYFRLALPIFCVILLIWFLQHIGAYSYYQQMIDISGGVRKEVDANNYYVTYPLIDTIKTVEKCLFVSTTQFTFVLWMLPRLFRTYMYCILITLAVDKCKLVTKLFFLCGAWYIISRYVGDYAEAISVLSVLAAWLYAEYGDKCSRLCRKEGLKLTSKILPMLIGIALLLLSFWIGTYWPGGEITSRVAFMQLSGDYQFWYSIGAMCIVLALLLLPQLRELLSNKYLVRFGELSYGFYLLHDCVQITLGSWLYCAIYNLTMNKNMALLVAFVSYIVGTTIIAYIFNKFVDCPIQRIIGKIYEKILRY